MKMKWLITLLFLITLLGCSSSKYGVAEQLLKDREYTEAIRAYLKLLNPHLRNGKRYIYYDREAITGIGQVYWTMQQYKTALKILKVVNNKEPSYGKALFYLGLCMEGLGDEEGALAYYQKFDDIYLEDPYRQVLRGRLDWMTRRKVAREIQMQFQQEDMLDIESLPEKSIAVTYFLSLSEDPQWRPLQKGITEMIISDLSYAGELKVVERLRLNNVMEELRFSSGGMIDENTAPRLGKLLGAKYLIKGSYMVMPNLNMTMDASVFKADEIFLPANMDFEGTLDQLFKIEKNLVLRVLDIFKVELSPEERERILRIPTENMMSFMSYCWGLDALDREDFETAQQFFKEALLYDSEFQMSKDLLMTPEIWAATHNSNLVRVNYELTNLIKTTRQGKTKMAFKPPPPLLSSWSRLQRMGTHQNNGFLPGNDTRESFIEADRRGAPVIPELLGDPPLPPELF